MNENLDEDLHDLLGLPAEERILARWEDIFINLDILEPVFKALKHMASQPDKERQNNLLISGESSVGKSKTLQHYVNDVMREAQATKPLLASEYANIPAFRIRVPVTDQASFYVRILEALGRKDRRERPLHRLSHDAVEMMRRCGVRLPIFDEFHSSDPEEVGIRTFGATLKDVGATIQRPMVLAGTEKAVKIIDKDPELSTRFTHIEMNRFASANGDFQDMLYNFETRIPLRKASNLADAPLCTVIFNLTRGLIGDVSILLSSAAVKAVETGEEQITQETLQSLDFAKSQQRRLRRWHA